VRPSGTAAAALSLAVAATVLTIQLTGQTATADDPTIPSRGEIQEAQEAARGAATDVESVQAELAAANQRLESSAIAAAQAAEAFNGARWQAGQARKAARLAQREAAAAAADYERQADIYSDTIVNSYETMPELSGLTAVLESEDLGTMLDRSSTLENASDAMDQREDEFHAASTRADRTRDQAEAAEADAVAAKDQAEAARDQARSAADAAAAEAQTVADEKTRLIGELARLQGVSVQLAAQRQAGLEQRAQEAAAAAAAAAAQQAAQEAAEEAAQQAAQEAAEQAAEDADEADQPDAPADEPDQTEQPDTNPPAPGGGAQAAIAFARAQIGEPYVWGADGPSSWDCSGLTMGAWAAGGKSLPHYSVAQYQQSTPISAGELRPGDLVFWGSSSSSSSIYHVALYVGDGMILQAPRTGRDVEEVSMYYWITPNFYARP
jgi:cell wall-associated NlpC family hydrolase